MKKLVTLGAAGLVALTLAGWEIHKILFSEYFNILMLKVCSK